jgi:hypothetical protein
VRDHTECEGETLVGVLSQPVRMKPFAEPEESEQRPNLVVDDDQDAVEDSCLLEPDVAVVLEPPT